MNTSKEIACFECGRGTLIPKIVDLAGHRHDEEFTVRAHGLECTVCGFKTIDSKYSEEFTKLISDAYRKKHGLLTGKQIREARRQLGMSQDEFARYLKVGPASVHRWENGQIQDEALNELLLLKTDPEAARHNYQKVAIGAGADSLVSYGEITGTIEPFVKQQFGTPKRVYADSVFQPVGDYAPLC
jgi:putative zinc finger/helix-turn-helix YgiT family protein